MEMSWSERLRHEGRQEGRQEGEETGYLRGMQTLLLNMLRQRFGDLNESTAERIRAITSAEELSRLAGEIMAGRKPPELGL